MANCKLYVEVPILLITFCFMLSEFITTNFIIYRTCYVIFSYNISECAQLGKNSTNPEIKDIETKVQPVASLILMSKTIVDVVITVFFSLIIGPWSNKHGRKPILISTYTGFLLSYGTLIVLSLLHSISPWWWLVCCILASLGGGFCSLITITYCYITDIIPEDNRAVRMAGVEACMSVGSLLGTLLSSYVFRAIGYTGIYGICSVITFIAILYLCFIVPESIPNVQQENKLKDLLDLSLILTSIRTCFKRRHNMDRAILNLIVFSLIIYIFVIFSNDAIFFLYVRKKFDWSLEMYTTFSAVNSLVDIFSYTFIIYFIAYCVSSVLFGIARTNWMIYLGAGVRRLGAGITPLARTAISKIIPPDDVGHVFAFLTSAETIVQLISSPLYTLLYNATISTEPSIFNFVSAGIFAINVIISGAVIFIKKRYPNEELRIVE